jgi:hypothetical protein
MVIVATLSAGSTADVVRGPRPATSAPHWAKRILSAAQRSCHGWLVKAVLVGKRLEMSARRDCRNGHWYYRKKIRLEDRRRVRIYGVPTMGGLPDSRAGTERAERNHIARVLRTGEVTQTPPPPKEVPKLRDFVEIYLDVSRLHNKPSSVDAKEATLRPHIVPALGDLRLDQVTYAVIEDFKLELARKPITNPEQKGPAESVRTRSAKSPCRRGSARRPHLQVAAPRELAERRGEPSAEAHPRDPGRLPQRRCARSDGSLARRACAVLRGPGGDSRAPEPPGVRVRARE